MLFMIGLALNDGLGKAFAALPGIALGLVFSITISLLGAGAVLLASAHLFMVLKLAGAAYLVFLGLRLWFTKPSETSVEDGRESPTKSPF